VLIRTLALSSQRDQHTSTSAKGAGRVIWDFLQRYDESWIWRCTNGHEVAESSRNFAGREECVADATQHGYTEPSAESGTARHTTLGKRVRRKRRSDRASQLI
jgi:hypothetical protein